MAQASTTSLSKFSHPKTRKQYFLLTVLCIWCTGEAIAGQQPSPSATQYPAQSSPTTQQMEQANDLLLKMILEVMLQLLDDIENTQTGSSGEVSTTPTQLESTAESLIWGYAMYGLEKDLTTPEIFQGIENGSHALSLIQEIDESSFSSPATIELLETAVEGMVYELESSL